jgi:hypothetical protein
MFLAVTRAVFGTACLECSVLDGLTTQGVPARTSLQYLLMGVQVHVDAYAGYRANERPRRFELDGIAYRIYAWERAWRTPEHQYFLVRADGKRYVLRHEERHDAWELLDQHDGITLFARPHLAIIPCDARVLRSAQQRILGCEQCHPDEAVVPFDLLVAELLSLASTVRVLLPAPACCPQCGNTILESTLVDYE